MADRLKLAQGLRNLPASAREDLAGREQDIQRGKTVELLRRAGKEMYENPIVNTAIGLSPVLGDIQAGVEAYRSAQEGDWGNAGLNAAGMLPFIPMLGKTVWHGSPHTFDKFDLSKIGIGEGAQAYGHGLYFTESKPYAEKYAKPSITDVKLTPEGKTYNLNTGETIGPVKGFPKHEEVLKDTSGSVYKVDLPDEKVAQMLDWYKPIAEQPEAYAAFKKYAQETQANPEAALNMLKEHTGAEAYSMWNNPEAISQFLHEQGVPGIRYMEQKYVAKPHLTPEYNYVVFSDEIPQILERNNQPVGMFK